MRRPLFTLLFLGTIAIGISIYILSYIYDSAAAADTNVTISTDVLSQDSDATTAHGQTVFSMRSRNGLIYKTKQKGATGVYEFLGKNIQFDKGARVALNGLPQELIPQKVLSDLEDPILKKAGKAGNRTHFYFKQKIGGLPVFGSQVAVHLQDDDQVYAMDGALVQDKTLQTARITEDRAQIIAINKVRGNRTGRVIISKKEQAAVNPRLLGLSEDQKTYPALIVTTNQTMGGIDDPYRTIVSLTDGSVLQSIELADYVLTRQVYDCQQNPTGSCNLVRSEGSAASGIVDADNVYGFLGEVYQFYSGKMQRDSYDNAGSTIKTFVNLPPEINGVKLCPNARWLHKDATTDNQLQACPGWVTRDIVAHELTHGVVEYTANLDFQNQSGALNEAIADTFATGVDDNWTIGEDLSIGAIRFLDDPSKNKSPTLSGGTVANPMPDRLFSTRYYCGTNDRGGVHANMSVPTKAFYLVVTGGSFNGCSMTGIGKNKALLIWYEALTKYLGVNSNFRDAYNAITQGCTDLYGSTSAECITVKKGMQAVEMDQQPLGDQTSPICNNIAAKMATCVDAATSVPPTITSAPPITDIACTNVQGDSNGDGVITVSDFTVWKSAFLKSRVP